MSDISSAEGAVTLPLRFDQLMPGELYHIQIDDCCVQAEFSARFVRWAAPLPYGSDASATPLPQAHFDGGVELHGVAWQAFPA